VLAFAFTTVSWAPLILVLVLVPSAVHHPSMLLLNTSSWWLIVHTAAEVLEVFACCCTNAVPAVDEVGSDGVGARVCPPLVKYFSQLDEAPRL
jgi:hypothetical protein